MIVSTETALAIIAGIAAYGVLFNLITALAGAIFGVGIERVQFGYPPSVSLGRFGVTEVRVSPILLGGHVKFAEKPDGSSYAAWPVRALLAIIGPVLAICICAMLLGGQAFDEAILTWPQLWTVIVDFSTPVNADAALAEALASGGLFVTAAVVAVKCAMFNLLPLPIFGGGAFILAILEGLTGKDLHKQLPQSVLIASLLALIAVVGLLAWRVFVGG